MTADLVTTRVPECTCLDCGHVLTAATGTEAGALPSAGDATICWYCGHVMIFTDDLTLRNPTAAEIIELAGHCHLLAAQRIRGKP